MKAIFQRAVPYAKDVLNLPVKNVESALPFYLNVMGFRLVSQDASNQNLAILERDQIQIGLARGGQGLFGGHDSQLFSFRGNHADRRDADLFVAPL